MDRVGDEYNARSELFYTDRYAIPTGGTTLLKLEKIPKDRAVTHGDWRLHFKEVRADRPILDPELFLLSLSFKPVGSGTTQKQCLYQRLQLATNPPPPPPPPPDQGQS